MTSEEIKNEFTNYIEGSHTINLAISILEERDLYKSIIKEAIKYIKSYNSTIKSRNELGIYADFMSIPKELLEILGDKENE